MDEGERVRIRLDLAYDGTDFAGWAVQPGLRTVQGELETALATLTRRAAGEPPRLTVAGRTDAGVHATGQVAHVDLTEGQLEAAIRRHATHGGPGDLAARLTGLLAEPGDVVVRRASIAPDGFDARFGAVFRRYRYRIADRLTARDPLQRRRTLHHSRALDERPMQESASALPGLHDFAAYCRPREGATTIRELREFTWRREEDGVLVAEVVADAFCHGMVRALVGAGIAVGLGRLPPGRVGELLLTPQRGTGFAVAPAHGLTLVEVGYPADDLLEEQGRRTRARRGSEQP